MRASGINRAFMQSRSLSAGPVIAASSAAGMSLGSEGNAQAAFGACAIAVPASAPARIVAKNSARSICKENVDIEHRPFLNGTDIRWNFIVGKLHVQLNCRWSPFSIGLHLFADIDPRGAGELGKSSERDSDSCVGRAPSGHDFLETL